MFLDLAHKPPTTSTLLSTFTALAFNNLKSVVFLAVFFLGGGYNLFFLVCVCVCVCNHDVCMI